MKRYSVILLDLDGTVFDFEAAERLAFWDMCGENGIPREARFYERYHAVNTLFWQKLERGEMDRGELHARRFRETFEPFGLGFSWEALDRSFTDHLQDHGVLFPGALELCTYLAKRYVLGAVTNGAPRAQRGRMAQSPLGALIPVLAIAQEAGGPKPAPDVFRYALELLGHRDKTDVLVLGDGYLADMQGGGAFGLDTLWYNPAGAAGGAFRPTYEVGSYEEIYKIL